jgi:8-oxo-dGTP pyrophosphatase MutT (NUDIX family)
MAGQNARSEEGGDKRHSRDALLHDAPLLADYLSHRLHAQSWPDPLARIPANGRSAGVLAPLYACDGAPYLLFTQRTTTLAVHSGEISFPGGAYETGDDSLAQTALRETYEELAIEPALVTILGQLGPVMASVSNYVVAPYVGWLPEGLPPLLPNPDEVAAIIEAPLAELADPVIFHEEIWTRGGQVHAVYFYDLGPHRIWGLTGRIVHTLLALLPQE